MVPLVRLGTSGQRDWTGPCVRIRSKLGQTIKDRNRDPIQLEFRCGYSLHQTMTSTESADVETGDTVEGFGVCRVLKTPIPVIRSGNQHEDIVGCFSTCYLATHDDFPRDALCNGRD